MSVESLMAHAKNEIVRLDSKRVELTRIKGAKLNILALSFLSYYEAENCYREGYLNDYQYWLYRTYWHWGNYRISSTLQEKYCDANGFEKLTVRINKFRNKLGLKPI